MFPQSLIDQWLSKSKDGRRSVQEDPKATPAILENIRHLEQHCLTRPYDVFCASALRSPPFARYALESEESAAKRLASPPLPFAATGVCDGIGGRYSDVGGRRATTAAATAHVDDVTARVAAFLQSKQLVPAPPPVKEDAASTSRSTSTRANAVAQLLVRVVAEAAVAAAVRDGVAARVEVDEQAVYQRQHARRKLQLRVPGDGADAVGGLDNKSLASRGNNEAEKGDGDDAGAAEADYVAVRPIAEYRRESQGLLALTALLLGNDAFASSSNADPAAAAPAKRARDNDDGGGLRLALPAEATEQEVNSERDGASLWTRLRTDSLRKLFGDQPLPPPPSLSATAAAAEARASQLSSLSASPAEGWAGFQLHITERDVLFAIQKVFKLAN